MQPSNRVGPYQTTPSHRKRKIQIFTQNKMAAFKRVPYQDTNPYELSRNPSTPLLENNHHATQDSNRDTYTETSSQKQGKIIRANGLKKAEKPNLAGSRSSQSSHSGRKIFHLKPMTKDQSNGHISSPHLHLQPPQNNSYQQFRSPQEFSSTNLYEQENRMLKQENARLLQKISVIESRHQEQFSLAERKIQKLFSLIKQYEEQAKISQKEWDSYLKKNQR